MKMKEGWVGLAATCDRSQGLLLRAPQALARHV